MNSGKIPLLVVSGPTASGKTRLAIDFAVKLGGEIVCADSMQVYKDMIIGTASPSEEETGRVPHHLFNIISPGESFSVARYLELAKPCIKEIAKRGKLPILCGGTGLYISSLIHNITFDRSIPEMPAFRDALGLLAKEQGNLALWDKLAEIDPQLAKNLHPNNQGRIIRALEVYKQTGITMSEWQRRSRLQESEYITYYISLSYRDREILYNRINRRVDQMIEAGLLDEIRKLAAGGYSGTAMQAIGYKEFAQYLEGKQTLEDAKDHLRRQTRRYAKRQLTWLRREKDIVWLYRDDFESYLPMLISALDNIRKSEMLKTFLSEKNNGEAL